MATASPDTESSRRLKVTTPSTSRSGTPASAAAPAAAAEARSSTDRPDTLVNGV